MSWLNILGVAVGLAMDAFAVSIAAGLALGSITPRHVFRLSFHFGLFQFMMPIFGYMAGKSIAVYIIAYDHWVVFGLLGFIGGKMLFDAVFEKEESKANGANPTKGWMLVFLSVATSLDALGVGLSMAFMRVSLLSCCVVIGVVAATFTAIGITFGSRLGSRWGKAAEVFGGCVLILIGCRMLFI